MTITAEVNMKSCSACVGACRDYARVLGLAVRGSYARGENDAFSDLDVDCYLRDDTRTGVEELHRRISALAPSLSVLYLYDQYGLYLFEDGVRLDVTYKPRGASPRDNSAGIKILHDPQNILGHELGTEYRVEARAHPRNFTAGEPAYVTWFFRQICARTKRGAQGGERSFDKLAAGADSLHMVRTSLSEMRLWTLDADYSLGTADPDLARNLTETYPRLVPTELLPKTRRLLALYKDVCPAYCAKAGVAYPTEKVAVLRRVLADLDLL